MFRHLLMLQCQDYCIVCFVSPSKACSFLKESVSSNPFQNIFQARVSMGPKFSKKNAEETNRLVNKSFI